MPYLTRVSRRAGPALLVLAMGMLFAGTVAADTLQSPSYTMEKTYVGGAIPDTNINSGMYESRTSSRTEMAFLTVGSQTGSGNVGSGTDTGGTLSGAAAGQTADDQIDPSTIPGGGGGGGGGCWTSMPMGPTASMVGLALVFLALGGACLFVLLPYRRS